MRILNYLIIVSFFIALLPMHLANAGIRRTAEEARQTELLLRSCSGQQQEVIDCVQSAMEGFGSGLSQGFPQKAPKVGPIIKDAAAQLKRVKGKTAALSVLSRVRATIRLISVKRKGEAKEIYLRVALTLSRALKVIKRKA